MQRVWPVQLLVVLIVLAPMGVAMAQEAGQPTGEQPLDSDAQSFLAGEEQQPEIEAPEEEEGIGWEEPQDMRFWMVGARWRMIMIPQWLLDAFFDFPEPGLLPRSVIVNQAAGLEFTTLKNNFAITGAIWWAGYDAHGRFIANEAGETDDPEWIDSDLHLLWFTANFTYNLMFTHWVGMTFGAGLGLGVVLTGHVHRHEAFQWDDAPDDTHHGECAGAGNAGMGHESQNHMCETDGGHYNAHEDGVWPVYPWIDILIGFRFKVFRHLEINVEGGVGLGFIFGLRASYIF